MAQGKAHKFFDNVDTDVIIPARYLNTPNAAELAAHCMEDIDADFVKNVKQGDIMVGGFNFGCGSSREHAPLAIKTCGVSCVIAKTFARIFYRNAINIGLPLIECPEAVNETDEGDVLEIDMDLGVLQNITKGRSYQIPSLPESIKDILSLGGLIEYVKNMKGRA